jgi:hypothetical protein
MESVALLPEGDDYVARLVLYLGARDDAGRESEIQRQEHAFRVPIDQLSATEGKRLGLDYQLLLREGQQRISVGVLDQVTRQASYQRIVVRIP